MWNRFQVGIVCLVETKINQSLEPRNFSITDTSRKEKETVSTISCNKHEFLGRRQQGRALTGALGSMSQILIATGPNSTGMCCD